MARFVKTPRKACTLTVRWYRVHVVSLLLRTLYPSEARFMKTPRKACTLTCVSAVRSEWSASCGLDGRWQMVNIRTRNGEGVVSAFWLSGVLIFASSVNGRSHVCMSCKQHSSVPTPLIRAPLAELALAGWLKTCPLMAQTCIGSTDPSHLADDIRVSHHACHDMYANTERRASLFCSLHFWWAPLLLMLRCGEPLTDARLLFLHATGRLAEQSFRILTAITS